MGLFSRLFSRSDPDTPVQDDPEHYIEITTHGTAPGTGKQPPVKKETWLARLRPGSQRERQIAWLQAGYSEMLDLVRSIRTHLDRQEDIQHKLIGTLEHLPESLDGLKGISKATEQQVEVLSLLHNQIESSVRHDQQLVESMNHFNETLGLMDETSRNSGRTVSDLVQRSREAEDLLKDVIERSERRVAFLITVFVLVTFVAVGSLLYLGLNDQWSFKRVLSTPPQTSLTSTTPEPVIMPEPRIAPREEIEQPVRETEKAKEPKGFWARLFHRN